MRKNPYADTPIEGQPRPDTALLEPKVTEKLPTEGTASEHPAVTVITAVFNAVKDGRKDELLQCMESVQEQSGITVEHLIIDGASQDGTVDLVKNYKNRNFPIRLLSEPDSGIYDAMNRGIWLAHGKYVIFLNSDDYYSNPAGLAESVRHLEESGADFSYAPICVLDEKTGAPVEHPNSHPNVNSVFVEMPFCHQSMLIRRKAMLDINGFDLRYSSAADYDSVLRFVFTNHRACFVPVTFVSFRLGGFSFVFKDQSYKEVGLIYSRHYRKYLGVELSPEEGTWIYVTKQCSKELKQRQFPWAQAAFGSTICFLHCQENDFGADEALPLKNRLHALRYQQDFLGLFQAAAPLFLQSPIYFGKFLLYYFRFRLHCKADDAGKKACAELLAQIQKKQKKNSSNRQSRNPSGPDQPYRSVTHQDFWCTTGIYMSEPWGAWTGKNFSAFFNLPEDYIHQPLIADLDLGGFVFPASPARNVEIVANGQKIGCLTIKNFMPESQQFHIPADIVNSSALQIEFVADKAFSPNSLGLGRDTRELGMTFRKLSLEKTAD